jgi:hypothetical protein
MFMKLQTYQIGKESKHWWTSMLDKFGKMRRYPKGIIGKSELQNKGSTMRMKKKKITHLLNLGEKKTQKEDNQNLSSNSLPRFLSSSK